MQLNKLQKQVLKLIQLIKCLLQKVFIICGVFKNLIDFIKPLRNKCLPKGVVPTILMLSKELSDDTIWNIISFLEQIF